MRSILLTTALLVSLCFLLTACPVSSKLPLAEKEEAISFEKKYIGTWINTDSSAEANKIIISKGTVKNTYRIFVLEKGSMFMAETSEFDAWITKLNDKRFVVLQEIKDEVATATYYVYNIEFENNAIITQDISLKVNGVDAITSVSAYQEEVRASMKLDGFLSSKFKYTKE